MSVAYEGLAFVDDLYREASSFSPSLLHLAMGTPGPLELLLLFAVVLLIFGAKRIPEIARGIGKGIREFKDATSEISRELEAEGHDRQINQPQRPQQGAPQSRQPQQRPSQEPASDPGTSGDAPASDQNSQTQESS